MLTAPALATVYDPVSFSGSNGAVRTPRPTMQNSGEIKSPFRGESEGAMEELVS